MNGPDALWAELSRGMPTSVTGMVAALGGSTRAAAEALGVTMRTVQRRLLGEAGAVGKQVRGQSVRGQAIGSKALRAAHANTLRDKTLDTSAHGDFEWGGGEYESRGDVRTLNDFDDGYADAMLDAFVEGNEAGAWEAFEDGIFDAYGMPDSAYNGIGFQDDQIDSLSMEWT